jgi:ATP diphosphatase
MKEFEDLWALVKHLRVKCPWDKKQTFDTAKEHLIEEVIEAKEAIEKKDWPNLKEEIGDTLFNLLFLCMLAEEEDLFSLKEVLEENHEKMVRRHPHVFGDIKASTPEEALAAFMKAKAEEKSKD